jgi:hypothetical protein
VPNAPSEGTGWEDDALTLDYMGITLTLTLTLTPTPFERGGSKCCHAFKRMTHGVGRCNGSGLAAHQHWKPSSHPHDHIWSCGVDRWYPQMGPKWVLTLPKGVAQSVTTPSKARMPACGRPGGLLGPL